MNTSQTLRPEERRTASDPSMTGSKALIESFLQEGVETVFGYPGGAIIPVYDALYDYRDRLRHILVRHEQGAVHAAQGYARVSGRVGVCLVTSGPGATNTVTGLADALMDSTPLVLVTGQVGSALLGTDAFQETNFVGITQAVTKWNCQVKRTEDIPAAIAKAFYIARSGRPGPVVVDITKDAQCGTAPFRYEKITSIRSYLPAPAPDAERIAEAARLHRRSLVEQQTYLDAMLAHVVRNACVAADFLAVARDQVHVMRRGEALADQLLHRAEDAVQIALHVERAATPQLPVANFARKRIAAPLVGVSRHHIMMAHQQKRIVAALAGPAVHQAAVNLHAFAHAMHFGEQRAHLLVKRRERLLGSGSLHGLVPDEARDILRVDKRPLLVVHLLLLTRGHTPRIVVEQTRRRLLRWRRLAQVGLFRIRALSRGELLHQ